MYYKKYRALSLCIIKNHEAAGDYLFAFCFFEFFEFPNDGSFEDFYYQPRFNTIPIRQVGDKFQVLLQKITPHPSGKGSTIALVPAISYKSLDDLIKAQMSPDALSKLKINIGSKILSFSILQKLPTLTLCDVANVPRKIITSAMREENFNAGLHLETQLAKPKDKPKDKQTEEKQKSSKDKATDSLKLRIQEFENEINHLKTKLESKEKELKEDDKALKDLLITLDLSERKLEQHKKDNGEDLIYKKHHTAVQKQFREAFDALNAHDKDKLVIKKLKIDIEILEHEKKKLEKLLLSVENNTPIPVECIFSSKMTLDHCKSLYFDHRITTSNSDHHSHLKLFDY